MGIFAEFEDVLELPQAHVRLLEALIATGPEGAEAFGKWVESVDFDKLDYASLRLVPAAFLRYREDPCCGPYRGRMKGIYRYFLFRTNLVASEAHRALTALVEAGIEVIVFKGLSIALRYHGNLALRPMADADVLVRPRDVQKAEAILAELGWRYRYSAAKKERDIHSHDYLSATHSGFDLHWYALPESARPGIDDGVWERAEVHPWQGLSIRVMSPEDTVLVSMVNGFRDPDSMRNEWVFDVVRILRSSPRFDWHRLWDEARLREVSQTVFDASALLRAIAPEIMTKERQQEQLEADPGLSRKLLHKCVAENRTYRLDMSRQSEIHAILEEGSWRERLMRTIAPGLSLYRRLASDGRYPNHLRYWTDASGDITLLHVHEHHLAWLGQLLAVGKPASLARCIKQPLRGGEGLLRIEPGSMNLRTSDILPGYCAKIDVDKGIDEIVIPAGEVGALAVCVTNDSGHCWFVREGSRALFGVSYHILSEEGSTIQWDQPRTYFMRARPGELAFVRPGQRLTCQMIIHAPQEIGQYWLQLDVLQETILWFSSQNVQFPRVRLKVIL